MKGFILNKEEDFERLLEMLSADNRNVICGFVGDNAPVEYPCLAKWIEAEAMGIPYDPEDGEPNFDESSDLMQRAVTYDFIFFYKSEIQELLQ